MAGRKKDPARTEATRNDLLKTGYELFTRKDIESVSMIEVAKESGYGTTTLYRYYSTKPKLVVAVAAWKWEQFVKEYQMKRPAPDPEKLTAAGIFEFYLDSFLELYDNHRDLLRFNQFFNVYVQSENMDAETIEPYRGVIRALKERFHNMYLKAEADHTLCTDIPEQKMFSATLHLMLAAVTRYAIGLVYRPENGFDALEELQIQKEAMLWKYGASNR
ncbi:MAG: TetR/AcrR family transcriptional regulator [Lachnospiraceae bacterium]|nr:TetR/AcrR family transcriptional regulator [Lachnospiraceae bacterium]